MGHRRRRRLSVLVLCDDYRDRPNAILDHIDAFRRYSLHDVRFFNPRGLRRSRFLDLDQFDAVVVHYSLPLLDDHLSPAFREQLNRYQGLKVQFVQDDYRRVDEATARIRELGVDLLYTPVPEEEIPKLYGSRLRGVTTVTTLTGYVPERLLRVSPPAPEDREIDIGYRARVVPYWLGRLGQEKVWIAAGVLARAQRYGLRCDISCAEDDRIHGRRWDRFLMSCKSVLCTESGASIADWDGSLEFRVRQYLAERPTASFEEVYEAILAPYEGNIALKVISPRVFEAIALRAALVLFPGRYSDVIAPWEHYIPLEKDFSNFDEVATRLRDTAFLRELTERAYRDVALCERYSYAAFVREFDELLAARAEPRRAGLGLPSRLARLEEYLPPRAVTLQRLTGSGLWRLGRLAARSYVAARVILGGRPLRRLAARYLARPDLRRAVPAGQLVADLLRLGILARVQASTLDAGEPFFVQARFDPAEGCLRLSSRPLDEDREPGPTLAGLRAALTDGRVRQIVWSHAAIGNWVAYPLVPFKELRFPVGRDNPTSVYSFDGLVALAEDAPDFVFAALAPMLNGDAAAQCNGGGHRGRTSE